MWPCGTVLAMQGGLLSSHRIPNLVPEKLADRVLEESGWWFFSQIGCSFADTALPVTKSDQKPSKYHGLGDIGLNTCH